MRDWLWPFWGSQARAGGSKGEKGWGFSLGLGEEGSRKRETVADVNPLSWCLGNSGARCPFPP